VPDIYFYSPTDGSADVRARMFAPFDGVPEDPATGSAGSCLAGLLCHHSGLPNGTFRRSILQGVEMGRPSVLEAEADAIEGRVVATRVGGEAVLVCDGHLLIE
jgi:trans-2,3-dihydro-3-hydroxyanthranilate isomerase